MTKVATTKMSSKGQVVIPEVIRERLKLQPGDEFVVVAGKDAIILKTIEAPALSEFDELLKSARRTARNAGLSRSELKSAVKEARRNG